MRVKDKIRKIQKAEQTDGAQKQKLQSWGCKMEASGEND